MKWTETDNKDDSLLLITPRRQPHGASTLENMYVMLNIFGMGQHQEHREKNKSFVFRQFVWHKSLAQQKQTFHTGGACRRKQSALDCKVWFAWGVWRFMGCFPFA